MSIIPNGVTIKSVNVNGVNMKEVYANSVKVFTSGLSIIKNSVSIAGALIQRHSLRVATYTEFTGHNGFNIKSSSSNNGCRVMYIPFNIKGYSVIKKIVGKRTYSGSASGDRYYTRIFVGSLENIQRVRYETDPSTVGCLTIYNVKQGEDEFNFEDLDISRYTNNDCYIGIAVNSYYGVENGIGISELVLQ